jgi:hypothetical protein
MVISFGLTKASAYHMDPIDKVFVEYLNNFIIVFVNDILVCTKDVEEHEEYLCLVL